MRNELEGFWNIVDYGLKHEKHLGGGETLPGIIASTLQWTEIQVSSWLLSFPFGN